MTVSKTKDTRSRSWAFIVYPDSAPCDWITQLRHERVPALISPLHDKDTNPDGEIKKAHYHVMMMFSGKKSEKQVQEISDKFSGVKVQKLTNREGYARYLIHMDNPEKFQYQQKDIQEICGASWEDMIGKTINARKELSEIMKFCRDNNIWSYAALCDWCRENNMTWFQVITEQRTVAISAYLKSLGYEMCLEVQQSYPQSCDRVIEE